MWLQHAQELIKKCDNYDSILNLAGIINGPGDLSPCDDPSMTWYMRDHDPTQGYVGAARPGIRGRVRGCPGQVQHDAVRGPNPQLVRDASGPD